MALGVHAYTGAQSASFKAGSLMDFIKQARLAGSDAYGTFYFCFPNTGIKSIHHLAQVFMWFCGLHACSPSILTTEIPPGYKKKKFLFNQTKGVLNLFLFYSLKFCACRQYILIVAILSPSHKLTLVSPLIYLSSNFHILFFKPTEFIQCCLFVHECRVWDKLTTGRLITRGKQLTWT